MLMFLYPRLPGRRGSGLIYGYSGLKRAGMSRVLSEPKGPLMENTKVRTPAFRCEY